MNARAHAPRRSGERWLPVLVVVTALAVWETAARVGWISSLFFPAPSVIARTRRTKSVIMSMCAWVTGLPVICGLK